MMVEDMDLVRTYIDAGVLVADDGIFLPAVPQPFHHLRELGRATVALMLWRQGHAEIGRLGLAARRDQVPPTPAAADLVERGEEARDMERFIEGGAGRRDEADLRPDGRERGQQRKRLMARHAGRAAPYLGIVRTEHRERVGGKDQVEATPLGRLRDLREMGEGLALGDVDLRVAPGDEMMAQPLKEQAEPHPALHHRPLLRLFVSFD